jgi:hypothetical protein
MPHKQFQASKISCVEMQTVIDIQETINAYLYQAEFLKKQILMGKQFPTSILKPTIQTKIKGQRGHIYAVKLDGCIKIGFSSDWRKRIKMYEVSSFRVEILFTKPAFQTQEMSFHKQHNNGSEKYTLDRENTLKSLVATHLKIR